MPRLVQRRLPLSLVVLTVLSSGPLSVAQAVTLTVTDFGDTGAPGQLRTLINTAASGDTIVIPAGTITLTGPANEDANVGGDLDILKSLMLSGAGPTNTVIDGGNNDRVFDVFPPATVIISGLTIQNGELAPSLDGGGVRNSGDLTLTNVTITNNLANASLFLDDGKGGGIANRGTLTVGDSVITSNKARSGGGMDNRGAGATATITNVTITNNTATGGNGGGLQSKALHILEDSSVTSNMAPVGKGGGIANDGDMRIARVTVSNNTSGVAGGGIQVGGCCSTGTLNVTQSTINLNSAASAGGAIENEAGPVILTNVTINENFAGGSGGAIETFGDIILTNVTVTANTTGAIASGIRHFSGNVQLQNTIVANIPPGGNCAGAAVTSLGHNLDTDGTCNLGAAGDQSGTVSNPIDPVLGPLQNNGGLTETRALLPGSPAIDAADNTGCPAIDQRGFSRPRSTTDPCDIGAYEAQRATSAPTVSSLGLCLLLCTLTVVARFQLTRSSKPH